MRNATVKELQERTQYYVEVTFENPNEKSKRKGLGPYTGVDEDDIKRQAVDEAIARWYQGENHRVTQIEERGYSGDVFHWDWKEAKAVGDKEFFKELDKQLIGSGREIVRIPFDGDQYLWFIGPRNEPRTGNPVNSQVRINYDDQALDIMGSYEAALKPHGVTAEEDGEEHDGWVIINLKSER